MARQAGKALAPLAILGGAVEAGQDIARDRSGRVLDLRVPRVFFTGQKQADVVFGVCPVDAHKNRDWGLGWAAWLFLGSWVHWVMGFEMRTASHGETLIRSRKRKERLGLV